jgi:GH18 family chitinase
VGGGQFYKSCEITGKDHLLDERPYEADAYVDLVRHIRKLGPKYEVSVALPGRKDDREVFQKSMLEQLDKCVNHFNLMSYDDMNRRDTRTKHHTGSKMVGEVVQYYNDNGVDKKRM